jgi:hypothetical protein
VGPFGFFQTGPHRTIRQLVADLRDVVRP